ncbi:MAG: hypothetical protein GTN99_02885 [Candidatus Dadabacteria bacterium]|nr:hypothetical protein [Candidatus Dadabacteria bacterium]
MARLGVESRLVILRKIYDELAEGKDEEALELRSALALDIRNHILKPYLKEWEILPEKWFPKSNGLSIYIPDDLRDREATLVDNQNVANHGYYHYRNNRTFEWKGCLLQNGYGQTGTQCNLAFPKVSDLKAYLHVNYVDPLRNGTFVAGTHAFLEYTINLRVPLCNDRSILFTDLSEELQERALILGEEFYQRNQNIKRIMVNSFKVLESCNTTKQLVKKWPEIERFIPAENEVTPRVSRSRTRNSTNEDPDINVTELTADIQELT